jgi:hypothetical protein
MSETKEALVNLRLLKAFLRIKDPVVRREVIEFVEKMQTPLKSEKEILGPSE